MFSLQALYLFPKFFEDKATEHLIGKGIKAEYLNDDKIGRVMDKLYEKGLSSIFLKIALSVVQKYQLLTSFSHQLMSSIKWLSRVPLSLGKAKELVKNILGNQLTSSSIEGYSWKEEVITYGEIKQRWLLVESQKRKESDLTKLSERSDKEKQKAHQALKSLMKKKFTSFEGATEAANNFSKRLKYYQLADIQIQEIQEKNQKKNKEIGNNLFQITATLGINTDQVNELEKRAGRFILATNELDEKRLKSDDILIKYKEQQAPERGFGFLKDPLFFADSVFLKSPQRVETMAMLMGLCLLVYSLGQRELRCRLKEAKTGLKNQLGKLTEKPTLRWIFQNFQGIHLVILNQVKQIVNLTEERRFILSFLPASCQKYYL